MAVETTTFTIEKKYFGLTNLPEPQTRRTSIPRQELFFDLNDEAVAAPSAGNSQCVVVIMDLPIAFAYAFTEMNWSIGGTDGLAWSTAGLMSIRDGNGTTSRYKIFQESRLSTGVVGTTGLNTRGYTFDHLPKRIIIPNRAESRVQFTICNDTIDDSAMVFSGGARFLVYDIAQVHDFEVNTPILVR